MHHDTNLDKTVNAELRATTGYKAATPPILISLAVGMLAVLIGTQLPWLNAMLITLVVGVVIANTPASRQRWVSSHPRWTKLFLRIGVVLLGLRLPFNDVIGLGWMGIAVIVTTVVVTYSVTCFAGDRLRLAPDLVTLIAAGFSICGAAAIAAIQDTIRARKESVANAIALVTIFGSLMIAFVPLAALALGLSDRQMGIWAGASIHEVAQVVAAATFAGTAALAVATTVKLGRITLLASVHFAATRRTANISGTVVEGGRRPPILPWFLIGFLLCMAIRSTGLLPGDIIESVSYITTVFLAAGMFGLGLGIKAATLLPVQWRAVGLAAISTMTALGVSLPLVLLAG